MTTRSTALAAAFSFGIALLSGCATRSAESRITNPNHPGPALGEAAGTVVGAVAGTVAGAAVGAAEGASAAAKSPFANEHRIVRTWRTETTSDGRTIQVPVETEVDEQGRPLTK
ncbi:flagellar motor protein MotB [Horticoccus luteus]|uniref:Flagellar motor protein MotB n=1 Tax=Horticoccus luteus TaxID=2862869 RepID=A0A8F9TXS8_9BACT|nr:flagellar motor protein MotB [Horticoccus luteus]QYM79502.1 flagellar motor protein MotB [Horticoccus luteus]